MFAKPSVVPEQEDLGVRRRLAGGAHERDRAAGRDENGVRAPRARERGARGVVGRPRRLGGEPLAGLGRLHVELDPERPQPLEVAHERGLCLERILLRVDAHADLRARGRHDRVDGAATGSTSIPVTVSAGPDQRRSPRPPVPMNGIPGSISASSRNSSSCTTRPSTPPAAARPRRRRRARRAGRERVEHREERVRSRAAELTRVLRAGERPHLDDDAAIPRSPTVSVGTPGRMLPMSPTTIASGEQLGPGGGNVVKRAARLLLALDHELDPDRRLALPGAQRADVHEDVRLRVRRAAPVDRAVALGRLERRRLPLRLVARGDDVVVPVQEHGRRALRRRDLADDDRRRVRQLERVELLDARLRNSSTIASWPRVVPAASPPGNRGPRPTGSRPARASSSFSCGRSAWTASAPGVFDGADAGQLGVSEAGDAIIRGAERGVKSGGSRQGARRRPPAARARAD